MLSFPTIVGAEMKTTYGENSAVRRTLSAWQKKTTVNTCGYCLGTQCTDKTLKRGHNSTMGMVNWFGQMGLLTRNAHNSSAIPALSNPSIASNLVDSLSCDRIEQFPFQQLNSFRFFCYLNFEAPVELNNNRPFSKMAAENSNTLE